MKAIQKFHDILDTERFGRQGRHYFIDIKKTRNQRHYLRITRTDPAGGNYCRRTHLILFEDDLGFFVEALTMVLGRLSQGQLGVSA
jgi:DNA repair protein RadC